MVLGFRRQFSIQYPESLVYGDIIFVLICVHEGKVMDMSDMMSICRIQPISITNGPKSVNSLVF